MKVNKNNLPHNVSKQLKSQWTEKLFQDKCRLATCNLIFANEKLVERTYPQRAHIALVKILNVQK